MNFDNLYTPEEIADKLKLSKYTIYEMIKRGDIEAYRMGRHIRISGEQLEIYMQRAKAANNIFKVTLQEENGECYAWVDSIKIHVNSPLRGKAKLAIAPEGIILSKEKIMSSARNVYKGMVTNVMELGSSAKVFLDIGIILTISITLKSLRELDIQPGMELFATFKTMSVKILR